MAPSADRAKLLHDTTLGWHQRGCWSHLFESIIHVDFEVPEHGALGGVYHVS